MQSETAADTLKTAMQKLADSWEGVKAAKDALEKQDSEIKSTASKAKSAVAEAEATSDPNIKAEKEKTKSQKLAVLEKANAQGEELLQVRLLSDTG